MAAVRIDIINNLATLLGRRDEEQNLKLAELIASKKNKKVVEELFTLPEKGEKISSTIVSK